MRVRKFRRRLRFREKAIAHGGVTRETFADNFQRNDGFEIAMASLISSAKCSLAEQERRAARVALDFEITKERSFGRAVGDR